MSKEPFLPLFFGDFLASTAEWEGEERALYLLLLGYQWSLGSLPEEPRRVCKLVGWDWQLFERCWPIVSRKLPAIDGRLRNPRLEEHRAKARSISVARSEAGKNGAETKWGETSQKLTRSERLAKARQLATHSEEEWQALLEVCGDHCVKCGVDASVLNGGVLCKDHVLPIYKGGSDGIENIQPMCRQCNSSKGFKAVDYRPNGWRECLAKRLANACHPSHPIPSKNSEVSSSSESPSLGGAGGDASRKRAAEQRGVRIPDAFMLTTDMRAWAASEAPHVDLENATREFCDYWRSIPGQRGRKLDWVATWRNRIRECEGKSRSRPNGVHRIRRDAPTTEELEARESAFHAGK